eukprot:CAMPEP_0170628900 /NCGR_PEP_ID=MMETSP0224-20130122/32992_1 /TAXON_ID=285029 /ORGANISM="Togula jolla, Strain CCCM 725" /LENGTH=471 /DNA_ID=CAMNT_0010956479 /DNA_START=91 /DNA_END=1509 /DNA_ORIENTATION=+
MTVTETVSRTETSRPVLDQLAEKVPSHLWRIHGVDYDLKAFEKVHPGGPIAIHLGRGEDCTLLFESYHLMNENHRRVLAAFAVKPDTSICTGDNDVSSPAPRLSAFHKDIKGVLRSHFKDRGVASHKAKRGHSLLMGVVFGSYLMAWVGYARGSVCAVLVLPLLAWLVMANLSHDGSHFAVSRNSFINQAALWAASPFYYTDATWYMQHIISHHLNTNDPNKDIDLHHHGQTRWHPQVRRMHRLTGVKNLLWHVTAFLGATFMLAVVQPLTKFVIPGVYVHQGLPIPHMWGSSKIMTDVMELRLAAGFATGSRLAVNAALWAWAAAVPVSAWWFYGLSAKGLLFGYYPYAMSAMLFMMITQVSHVQAEIQRPEATNDPDFFRRQAMTSLDYSGGSVLWGFLTGGLNTQSVHHVAPAIHSSHYPDLFSKFRAVYIKHGCLPAQAPNLLTAFYRHLCHVYSMGELYVVPSPEM